jgi:hypothetical protein
LVVPRMGLGRHCGQPETPPAPHRTHMKTMWAYLVTTPVPRATQVGTLGHVCSIADPYRPPQTPTDPHRHPQPPPATPRPNPYPTHHWVYICCIPQKKM